MTFIRNILVLIFCIFLSVFSEAGESTHFADSINTLIKQTKETKQQITLLLEAAKKLQSSNPDDALFCANLAFSMAAGDDYQELRVKAMINIGIVKVIKTEYASGLEMALKARDLATQLKDDKALGESNLIIGTIKLFQSNYGESLKNNFYALQLFEKTSDNLGIIMAWNGIGNVCYYQGENNKAFYYYSRALNLAREIEDTNQIASMLNNVGLVLTSKKQLDKAANYFQEAISINSKLGNKLRLASNYMNLGTIYRQLNRYSDFVDNYNKAVNIYIATGSTYQLCICYLGFTNYYNQLNDRANELKYAMISYSEGKKHDIQYVIMTSSGYLHDYYLKTGNIDSAYKYAMIKFASDDNLKKDQSIASLKLLEMEYNYDKTQKEVKLKQQRRSFINIILLILAISGLIIAILFLSRQIVKTKNIRLEKQQLSDEVEYKNKELTINVMSLIKKSELIVDLSNRLIQMEHNSTEPMVKSEILQIVKSLQRNSNHDIWEEFEVRFRQVHTNFYEKLLARFPDLTPSELKLCALLRLKLSTKEICELTGQLPSSLDMARYRLRKKLNLADSTVNLVSFLSQV